LPEAQGGLSIVRIRRITSHTLQAVAEGSLIALLVVGLMAGTAFAGKGKPPSGGAGTGASVTMVLVDQSDGVANWGDEITYAVSTSAAYPYVSTTCTQGGVLVLSTSAGYFDSYAWPSARVVPLTTDRWTGGAADCTARLYTSGRHGTSTLATKTFHVSS
jgi:hypothetical protein